MLIGTWSLSAMWWSPENYRCHMKKQDINYQPMLCCFLHIYRADSRLAPSQWEMSLQSNAISHLRGANLESALYMFSDINYSSAGRWIFHATNTQSLFIIKSLRLGAVLVPLKNVICILYAYQKSISTNESLKQRVNLSTLSSLVAPLVVIMTNYGATSDNKVVSFTNFCFST